MQNLKKILNKPENLTHSILQKVCERNDALVFAKVRLADVFAIEGSGISSTQYRFALQSHFDFIVTGKNHIALFAVEFDGVLHTGEEQKARDIIKDSLCDKFGLPILRINSKYIDKSYRGVDLLTWFIEVWFLQDAFYKAQENGEIPYDEPFTPQFFISISGYDKQFPLWLSAPIGAKIQKLCLEEKVKDFGYSTYVNRDERGNYKAISYIRVTETEGIMDEIGMRGQKFPVSEAELLMEIAPYFINERLEAVMSGQQKTISLDSIRKAINTFKEKNKTPYMGIMLGGEL